MTLARPAPLPSSRRTRLHRASSSVRFPSQRCFVGVLTFRGRDPSHAAAQDPGRPAGEAHRQEVHRAPRRDAPRLRPPRVLPEDGLARAKLLPGVRMRTAHDEAVHLQGMYESVFRWVLWGATYFMQSIFSASWVAWSSSRPSRWTRRRMRRLTQPGRFFTSWGF